MKGIVFVGMQLMDAMDVRSAMLGKRCSKWTPFDYRSGHMDLGAITLVLDLAKAFVRVSLPVGWASAPHISTLQEDVACAVRLFRAPTAGSV